MTDEDLNLMAFRAVDDDLNKLLFDRPEITARVSSGAETRFVHGRIRSIVEDLRERLVTLAGDEGINLRLDREAA